MSLRLRPLASTAQMAASQSEGAPPAHLAVANNRITFSLYYDDDDVGIAKRVEFEAPNAALALDIAGGEAEGRLVILCEGARPLCRLVKSAAGTAPLWVVLSAASADGPVGSSTHSCQTRAIHRPSLKES